MVNTNINTTNSSPKPQKNDEISSARKTWNKIATYCRKPDHIILIVFGILLTIGIIAPMFSLVSDSFTIHAGFENRFSEKEIGSIYPFGWLAAFNQDYLG